MFICGTGEPAHRPLAKSAASPLPAVKADALRSWITIAVNAAVLKPDLRP